jgi:hypothetical protein
MDVQAAERGAARIGLGRIRPCRDHRDIGIMGGEPRLFLLTAHTEEEDRDAKRLGRLLDRRGDQLPPAPSAGAGGWL